MTSDIERHRVLLPVGRLAPTLVPTSPTSPLARQVLRAYWMDIVTRYWGRSAKTSELDRAIGENPSDDLALPTGLFVVAVSGEDPVGCGGVRLGGGGIAQLTRIWVVASARRRGLGAVVVEHLEQWAVDNGTTLMRVDTRSDLVEARALYAGLGYREVAPFNDGPYAEHWFEKAIGTAPGRATS